MSDFRKPVKVWKECLPEIQGNKVRFVDTLKVELFPAFLWKDHWDLERHKKRLFYPNVPLSQSLHDEYWNTRFRIRVNDSWVMDRATFQMFTKKMIRERYFN